MPPELQTRRLLLRPLQIEDAVQVQQIFPQWEIVQYLAAVVPWPYPADGAEQFYRHVAIPAMERGEAWHWTLRLRTAPDIIIGAIGLMSREEANRGFWLAPDQRGQGLMTEAANAVTDYWFNVLGFPVMRIPKAVPNEASRRISERQGMRVIRVEERDYVSGRYPTEIWEITAEEWRQQASARV